MLNPWKALDTFLLDAAELIRAERPAQIVCDDGTQVEVSYGSDERGAYAEVNGGEPVDDWAPVAQDYDGSAAAGDLLALRLYLD